MTIRNLIPIKFLSINSKLTPLFQIKRFIALTSIVIICLFSISIPANAEIGSCELQLMILV